MRKVSYLDNKSSLVLDDWSDSMTKDEYVHSDIVDELSAGGQQAEINEKK